MNKKELALAKLFIEKAGEEYGNGGCNDVDESVYEGWTVEERRTFVKENYEWNGDPEEYDENDLHLPDFSLYFFLTEKLLKFVEASLENNTNK